MAKLHKKDLINKISTDVNITGYEAERWLDGVLRAFKGTLSAGDDVSLPGFGTLKITNRAARKGRNPSTGETIDIAASNSVGFKPAPGLKELVNT
jgi:DNA-binding protein HU-beta